MNNETSNITPYEIRLNLLQIAERVVTANVGYDVENAKSMGSNHFPKIKTEDILDTATRLKEFVDGSKPKKQYPKPPPDEPTSPWVVVDTHTIKSTGSTGPIVKAQPSTNPFGPEDATNFLSRLENQLETVEPFISKNRNIVDELNISFSEDEVELYKLFKEKPVKIIQEDSEKILVIHKDGTTTTVSPSKRILVRKCWEQWKNTQGLKAAQNSKMYHTQQNAQ